MNKSRFEQKIMAARPSGYLTDDGFTDRVMTEIAGTEIISRAVRIVNVKQKETFIMRLRKFHKPSIAIAALVVAFIISGTAYAAFLLWPQPSVQTSLPATTADGRVKVSALFKDCGDPSEIKKTYELKKDSPITADKVPQLLQARCEIDAIKKWTEQNETQPTGADRTQPYKVSRLSYPTVYIVESVSKNTITLAAQPKYNMSQKTITVIPSAKIIANAAYTDIANIKPGDRITYTARETSQMVPGPNGSSQSDGAPSVDELLYVIRLELPFEAYDPLAQQSLAQRTPCLGNEQDTCVESGAVDLFQGTVGLSDPTNPNTGQTRSIQGKIVSFANNQIVIKTSSGRELTFAMKYDVIDAYNQQRSADYGGVKLVAGDMLTITYVEPKNIRSLTIPQSQVFSMQYMLELVGKSDPLKKY